MNEVEEMVLERAEAIAAGLMEFPEDERMKLLSNSVELGRLNMIKDGVPADTARNVSSYIADRAVELIAPPNPEMNDYMDSLIADLQTVKKEHRYVMVGRLMSTLVDLPKHELGQIVMALGARMQKFDSIREM